MVPEPHSSYTQVGGYAGTSQDQERWQLSQSGKATLEEAYVQPGSWIRNRQQGMSPTQQVTKQMVATLGVDAAYVRRWFASRSRRDAADGRIAVTATVIAASQVTSPTRSPASLLAPLQSKTHRYFYFVVLAILLYELSSSTLPLLIHVHLIFFFF